MRIAVWVAYGVLLLLLLLATQWSNTPANRGQLIAARNLPANRMLREEDVVFDGAGVYLRRPVKRGARLRDADLAAWPAVTPPKGNLAVALSLKDPKLGPTAPNAGEKGLLCPKPANGPATLPVLAILCGPGAGECHALVAVTPSEAKSIATAQAAVALSIDRTCR
jgi:hypothetical protein